MPFNRASRLEKWQTDAAAQGWAFVAKADGSNAFYVHNACGHGRNGSPRNMRIGKVRCRVCEIANWQTDAAAQGWTFVAKADAEYASYTHNACGRTREAGPRNMRIGTVRCRICEIANWQTEAAAQGWTFVGQADGQYSSYTHNACGHKQQAQMGAMRNGYAVCHGCGESWATKPSNLYLLDITTACGQRFLKLGTARVVTRRAQGYGLAEGAKSKVLYTKAYATGAEARKVEKQLHKTVTTILCVKRFKGAKKLMSSGHTECYEYSPEAAGHLLLNLPN